MRRISIFAAVAALALIVPAVAEAKLVGKKAPYFSVDYPINEPRGLTLEECKGEVILIKLWGIQ